MCPQDMMMGLALSQTDFVIIRVSVEKVKFSTLFYPVLKISRRFLLHFVSIYSTIFYTFSLTKMAGKLG